MNAVRFGAACMTAFLLMSLPALSLADANDPPPIKQKNGTPLEDPVIVHGQALPKNENDPQSVSDGLYGYNGGGIATRSGSGAPHVSTHVFQSVNVAPTTNPADSHNSCPDEAGEPIEVSYGSKVESQTLFAVPGEMGLSYSLYYRSVQPLSCCRFHHHT